MEKIYEIYSDGNSLWQFCKESDVKKILKQHNTGASAKYNFGKWTAKEISLEDYLVKIGNIALRCEKHLESMV